MREILFRGKRLYNGEWAEGYYATKSYTKNTCGYILENKKDSFAKRACLVDSRTVGQYTGLTDKNGKKIFEGDIVEFRTSLKKYYAKVYYKKGMWSLYIKGFNDRYMLSVAVENDYSVKVIGNIHDNPELLEVTK